MFITAFFGGLRISEYTSRARASHHILMQNTTFFHTHISIVMLTSKTSSQSELHPTVILQSNTQICVDANGLLNMLSTEAFNPGPIFVDTLGQPISHFRYHK